MSSLHAGTQPQYKYTLFSHYLSHSFSRTALCRLQHTPPNHSSHHDSPHIPMASVRMSRLRGWLLSSPPAEWALNQLRELLIGALRQGPVPKHVAFVMDGNRRFAKRNRIETVEGHNLGFEALARVCTYPPSQLYQLTSSDPRSMLQSWRYPCHYLCFQYRELQTVEI